MAPTLLVPKKAMENISDQLHGRYLKWILNPPGASHRDGMWDRKIAAVRRVLDSVFLELKDRHKLARDE